MFRAMGAQIASKLSLCRRIVRAILTTPGAESCDEVCKGAQAFPVFPGGVKDVAAISIPSKVNRFMQKTGQE